MKASNMVVSLSVFVVLVSCSRLQEESQEAARRNAEKNTLTLTCIPPEGMAGNAAIVKGVLKLEKQPTDQYLATGKVDILIGGLGPAKVLDKKGVEVGGVYDRIPGAQNRQALEEHLNLRAVDENHPISILINFKSPLFVVEYKGKSYQTHCKHKVSLDNR